MANVPNYLRYICSGAIMRRDEPSAMRPDPASIEQALFDTDTIERPGEGQDLEPARTRRSLQHGVRPEITDGLRVDPVDAAKDWFKQVHSTAANLEAGTDTHVIQCPLRYQAMFFRKVCFLRMQQAAAKVVMLEQLISKSSDENTIRFRVKRRPDQPLERIFSMQVKRESLIEDALDSLWHIENQRILLPLKVQILEEEEQYRWDGAQDVGGVSQEFFQLAISGAFHPDYGMFRPLTAPGAFWFNPWSYEPLHKFEMLGTLMALAIHNGFVLPISLPLLFYWKLRISDARPEDFPIEDGWPDMFRAFRVLLDSDEDAVDALCFEYSFRLPPFAGLDELTPTESPAVDISKVALDNEHWTPWKTLDWSRECPNHEYGPVTNANKHRFVSTWLHWLTKSVDPQITAFAKGFHAVLPLSILQAVSAQALKALVEGEEHIDSQLLKRTVPMNGFEDNKMYVDQFWSVVHAYRQEELRRLLKFVTANSRLPVGMTGGTGGSGVCPFEVESGGFDDAVSISSSCANHRILVIWPCTRTDHLLVPQRLPTASTCSRTLRLPRYSSTDLLRQRLQVALENDAGFGFA